MHLPTPTCLSLSCLMSSCKRSIAPIPFGFAHLSSLRAAHRFLYVAINLGSSGSGLAKALGRGLILLGAALVQLVRMIPLPKRAGGGRARSNSLNSLAGSTSGMGTYFKRQVLVDSKFLLGELVEPSRR